MATRTALVTGANAGIGLETARGLAKRGYRVVLTARDSAKGEAAIAELRRTHPEAELELLRLDLASLQSVRAAAAEALDRFERIEVLVNNAGIIVQSRQLSVDGHELTFAVNFLGPYLFTRLLLDRLLASAPARVVNVSSEVHRQSRGLPREDLSLERDFSLLNAYANSKLANILFTRELARRTAGSGLTTNALHPGAVATRMGQDGDLNPVFAFFYRLGHIFMLSPEAGARTSVYLASSPEVEGVSGGYFKRCKPIDPSKAAQDEEAARWLWERAAQLVGLDGPN